MGRLSRLFSIHNWAHLMNNPDNKNMGLACVNLSSDPNWVCNVHPCTEYHLIFSTCWLTRYRFIYCFLLTDIQIFFFHANGHIFKCFVVDPKLGSLVSTVKWYCAQVALRRSRPRYCGSRHTERIWTGKREWGGGRIFSWRRSCMWTWWSSWSAPLS